ALGPLIDRAVHGPDPERAKATRAELDLLSADVLRDGVLRPQLLAKRRVHKRLFTAAREGYVRFGAGSSFLEAQTSVAERDASARRDRRGYFLDAWNQPYWLLYELAGGRRILLYSFGANRRRDTALEKTEVGEHSSALGVGGDDIAVRVP